MKKLKEKFPNLWTILKEFKNPLSTILFYKGIKKRCLIKTKHLGSFYMNASDLNDITSFFIIVNSYHSNWGIGSYGNPTILFEEKSKLTVGKFCSIASDVTIFLGGEHETKTISSFPFTQKNHYSKGDVTIGNDVWIGRSATILSGVTIGDGAVIGTNSIVTKDVEPYSIVAGNPAKIIKYRFDEETIKRLLKVKWWDFDINYIWENRYALNDDDLDEFFKKFDKKHEN